MISLSKTGYFQDNQLKALKTNGVSTINDLLLYIPKRYIDRTNLLNLQTTKVGDNITFIGMVVSAAILYGKRRRFLVKVKYEDWSVDILFFQGITYYQKMLRPGIEAAFSGTLEKFAGKFSLIHPEFELLTGDEFLHTGKIVPIYKTTEGMRNNFLTSRTLREAIRKILNTYSKNLHEYLSQEELTNINLLSICEALELVHFPKQIEDVKLSKDRLAFDEILVFSVIMYQKKIERMKIVKPYCLTDTNKNWRDTLINSLPFSLTQDQLKAINYLYKLGKQSHPFGALLQGDVGSGKTLVALAIALEYMEDGIQVALLAPTEVLARQHYQSILNFLSSLPMMPIDLLLGGEKTSERNAKLQRLKQGSTLLFIGTHSLLQDDIYFHKLGLVIIDEQHRFGVEQREKIRSKGTNPDLLAMTATPIPRSLTLTFYGDLETILINEKPKNRLPIDTRLFSEGELEVLYKGIKKYVNQGRQAYIVYPLIEESEKISWASLNKDYDELQNIIFKDYKVGLLHGKLSSDEKDKVMRQFKEGSIHILIATTVIEVGVDVPNATVMLIRNSEKFGLSQLHQLRGRVGRGSHQSFCILTHSLEELTIEAKERLQAMVDSNDGFYLAQKDLEIRGAGELLGIKQSGMSEFRIADLRYHSHLAKKAEELLQSNVHLAEYMIEQKNLRKFLERGMILFTN